MDGMTNMQIKIHKGIIYRNGTEYPVWQKGLHIIRSKAYKQLTIRYNYAYTDTKFKTFEIDIFKKVKVKNASSEDSYCEDYYEPKRKGDYL